MQGGASITVLSQVNAEWLYGELYGEKGRFPVAYIDQVPDGLPPHTEQGGEAQRGTDDGLPPHTEQGGEVQQGTDSITPKDEQVRIASEA